MLDISYSPRSHVKVNEATRRYFLCWILNLGPCVVGYQYTLYVESGGSRIPHFISLGIVISSFTFVPSQMGIPKEGLVHVEFDFMQVCDVQTVL